MTDEQTGIPFSSAALAACGGCATAAKPAACRDIGHLNELNHDINRWRWTWQRGVEAKAQAEAAGGQAIVPLWGERLA